MSKSRQRVDSRRVRNAATACADDDAAAAAAAAADVADDAV